MAAVEITISGTLYDKLNRTTQQVVLVGDASLTGLGIGGGPLPGGPGPGPGGPRPSHPIALPGDPWWGQDLRPTHPIALPGDPWWPKPPTEPPPDAGVVKPPPAEGGWGYHPEYGWGYFPMGQSASPKKA
jgi:hypothetical protein